jgi:hypothetical protein
MRVPDLATPIYKLVHFIDAIEANDFSHHLTSQGGLAGLARRPYREIFAGVATGSL